jgi:hypothetical protein
MVINQLAHPKCPNSSRPPAGGGLKWHQSMDIALLPERRILKKRVNESMISRLDQENCASSQPSVRFTRAIFDLFYIGSGRKLTLNQRG